MRSKIYWHEKSSSLEIEFWFEYSDISVYQSKQCALACRIDDGHHLRISGDLEVKGEGGLQRGLGK